MEELQSIASADAANARTRCLETQDPTNIDLCGRPIERACSVGIRKGHATSLRQRAPRAVGVGTTGSL